MHYDYLIAGFTSPSTLHTYGAVPSRYSKRFSASVASGNKHFSSSTVCRATFRNQKLSNENCVPGTPWLDSGWITGQSGFETQWGEVSLHHRVRNCSGPDTPGYNKNNVARFPLPCCPHSAQPFVSAFSQSLNIFKTPLIRHTSTIMNSVEFSL